MTNRHFLERLISLTNKLGNSADTYGYRSDEYNAVLKEINETGIKFNRHIDLWRWLIRASIVFLLCAFAYVLYRISFQVEPL